MAAACVRVCGSGFDVDPYRALGVVLLQGPRGVLLLLVSEVFL